MYAQLAMIVNLMVMFAVKHYVCDFLLQGKYMLGKFNLKGWQLPLAAHCAVHAAGTFIIVVYYVGFWSSLILAIADFITHFGIDKAKVEISRGLDPNKDPEFWHMLGFDQFCHSIVHILIILQAMSFAYD